jgi:fumarate hydratase class II
VRVPLIARNLLSSIGLLANAATALNEKCVAGIKPNRAGCERSAESTLATATALNPYIGYDKGAELVQEATRSGRPLREVARDAGVEEQVLDRALDLRKIARGG